MRSGVGGGAARKRSSPSFCSSYAPCPWTWTDAVDALVQVAELVTGAEKVHVIAHSMGNRGLLRALQRIAGRVKFGQIFLAAPDVGRTHFLNLAHLYAAHSERTTLYASNADRAVHLSAVIHDAPRAGYFKPYTVTDGVDTVAVPNFDIDWLGHGYYAQAEGLLYDIHALMRHGDEPAQRQRITLDYDEGTPFWKLRR